MSREKQRARVSTASPPSISRDAFQSPARSRRRQFLIAVGYILLAVAVYAPSWGNGYIWDDDAYITNNPVMEVSGGLRAIWFNLGATPDYYPLTFTLIWIGRQLWGVENATPYHIVSTLIHAAGAILFWRLLLKLRIPEPGAWAAAAIFVVHPVQVESVAWATEIKTLLAFTLGIASWLAFIRFDPLAGDETKTPQLRWGWLVVSVVCFVAAVLAKTVAVTLPMTMAIVFCWREGRSCIRRIPWLALMLAFAAPMVYAAFWTQHHVVGAHGAKFELSSVQRLLLVGRTPWFYLAKLVWPLELIFIYPRWELSPGVWWQWLYPAATVAFLVTLAALHKRIGWGPLAAVAVYGVTLGPALGLFKIYWQVYSYVADHVQYAAAAAMFAIAGAVYAAWARRSPKAARLAIWLVLIALGARAMAQTLVYRDRMTLWNQTLADNPDAVMARNNLAIEYSKIGRHDLAIGLLLEAKNAEPDDAEIRFNIGNEWAALAEQTRAEVIREETRTREAGPQAEAARHRVAELRGEAKKLELTAMQSYREAIELNPGYADAHSNLGKALMRLGDLAGAVEHISRSVEIEPANPHFRFNLGVALANAGRLQEAEASLSEASRALPRDEGISGALRAVRAEIARRMQSPSED